MRDPSLRAWSLPGAAGWAFFWQTTGRVKSLYHTPWFSLQVQQPCSHRLGEDGRAVAAGEGGRAAETEAAADPSALPQPYDRKHPHVYCWRCHPTPGRDGSVGHLLLGLWLPLRLGETWLPTASLPAPPFLSIKWRELTFSLVVSLDGRQAGWPCELELSVC